ncbi:MAG: hypothetical protein GY861_06455 [bacterium]|nr:hypothetical protein [bacterium]
MTEEENGVLKKPVSGKTKVLGLTAIAVISLVGTAVGGYEIHKMQASDCDDMITMEKCVADQVNYINNKEAELDFQEERIHDQGSKISEQREKINEQSKHITDLESVLQDKIANTYLTTFPLEGVLEEFAHEYVIIKGGAEDLQTKIVMDLLVKESGTDMIWQISYYGPEIQGESLVEMLTGTEGEKYTFNIYLPDSKENKDKYGSFLLAEPPKLLNDIEIEVPKEEPVEETTPIEIMA